ncbi:MAG: AI-2E family transporter [Burkholderiales bacterium]
MPELTQKNARLIAAACLVLLGIWIMQGFLVALIWAVVIAIATWPLYQRFLQRLPQARRETWGCILFTSLIALMLLIPLAYAILQIGFETRVVLNVLNEAQKSGLPAPDWLGRLPFAGAWALSWWNGNLANPGAATDLLLQINSSIAVEWSKAFGKQVLHRMVTLGVTLITLYFVFRDGARLAQEFTAAVRRMVGDDGERYIAHMASAIRAAVNGLVLVGLAEGVLLAIAYALAGLQHAALLGALTGLFAMIPFAAPVIFGGASLVLLAQGNTVAALLLFSFGSVVLFVADHFVRPVLIGGAARLPFLWVLLGILGGLETLGLLGLFLGPAIMAALMSLWRDLRSAG